MNKPDINLTTVAVSRRRLFTIAGLAGAAAAMPAVAWGQQPSDVLASAAQSAGFYRFKIGKLEAIALSDGQSAIAPIKDILAPDMTDAQIGTALADAFHPTDSAPIQFNILLVRVGGDLVLFDGGNGGKPSSAGGNLPVNLAAAGIKPEQITAIIISHAHPDHIGGLLDAAGAPVFKNARYIVNKAEHDFWTSPTATLPGARIPDEWKKAWIAAAAKTFTTLAAKVEKVAPGDKLFGAIELLDAAGHTAGHMPAIIRDGDTQVVAMADLAHNHVLMVGNPDSSPAFDADPKAAAVVRRKHFDRFAVDRMRIFGYHMPWPGVGHLRRKGNGFEWAIEPWSW